MNSSHGTDQLKRFYRLPSPDAASSSKDAGFIDYARGEGALSSSGSEDEGEDDESEVEEKEVELGQQKRNILPRIDSDEDSDEESHLDIDLSEDEAPGPEAEADGNAEAEEAAVPTKRIAAVNLDWDNLRAADLFAAFHSFLKSSPGISSGLVNVKIYPSEFGKGRMEKEELEGPGGGVFVNKKGDAKKIPRTAGSLRRNGKDQPNGFLEDEVQGKFSREGSAEGSDGDEEESDIGNREDEAEVEDGSEGGEDNDETVDEDEDEDGVVTRRKHTSREIDGLEIVSDMSSQAGEDDIDMDQLRQYQLERLR